MSIATQNLLKNLVIRENLYLMANTYLRVYKKTGKWKMKRAYKKYKRKYKKAGVSLDV